MDTFSSRIETQFSNILTTVESMQDGQDKSEAFLTLVSMIEGTYLIDTFYSRIEKLISTRRDYYELLKTIEGTYLENDPRFKKWKEKYE